MPHQKKWLTQWSVYKHRALLYTLHCAPLIVPCEWVQVVHNLLRRHSNIPMSQGVRFGNLRIPWSLPKPVQVVGKLVLWGQLTGWRLTSEIDWYHCGLTSMTDSVSQGFTGYRKCIWSLIVTNVSVLLIGTAAGSQQSKIETTSQVFNTRIPFVPILIKNL